MISFSCADYAFPLLPRTQRFALLQLLGFKYVDIGLFERSVGLKPNQLLEAPKTFIKQLKHDLKCAGLRVSDVFLQTGLDPAISAVNDPNPQVRSRNRKTFLLALNLCMDLDCTHMTGLPGVWHKRTKPAGNFALAVDEAAWRQCKALNAGVRYAIEPHIGSICADVARTHFLLDAAPGLTLTLDYGHFVSAGIDSHAVHSLLPFASHIHARGGALNRLQTSVSENEIDFDGIVRRLYKQKYKGFLAVEYVWVDWKQCNRTDNVSETILLRRRLADLMKSARSKV